MSIISQIFQKKWFKGLLLVTVSIMLTACYDASSGSNISNLVNANLVQTSYTGTVGVSTSVPITFTTNTGTATNLSVDLSSLPSGWSKSTKPNSFSCASVTSSGTECQLDLNYGPSQVTPTSTLSLPYTYVASDGTAKSGVVNITYNAVNATFAFIPNTGNNSVLACMLNTSGTDAGTFSACNPSTDSSFNAPTGMALFTATTGTEYAYVPNNNDNIRSTCVVDASSGQLSACQSSITLISGAQSMAITPPLTGGTFAYIAGGTSIARCAVNTTSAQLSGCATLAPGLTFVDVTSVAFHANSAGNTLYAYILDAGTDSNDGNLYKCTVDQSNGVLTGCTIQATGLPAAIGKVTFYTGTNATYAYFINNFNGTIVAQYTVDGTDGSLSNPTTTGTISTNSQNVTVQVVNGTAYAYIPDSINEAITRCTVSPSTGGFSQCAQLTTPDPALQSVPFDVVF